MTSGAEIEISKLSRAERDRLAAKALAAKRVKSEQNRRARQRSKDCGLVRVERLVPRELVEELRELITLYLAARKQGLLDRTVAVLTMSRGRIMPGRSWSRTAASRRTIAARRE